MNFPANKAEILPWLFSGPRLIVILTLTVVGIVLLVWAESGSNSVATGPEVNKIANIGIDEGKNAVVANLITNQQQAVNNAETVANQANGNLANSLKRDTNEFSGGQSDADDAFCSHYPTDSSCAGWRLRHGR